jgi:hypothetical protein
MYGVSKWPFSIKIAVNNHKSLIVQLKCLNPAFSEGILISCPYICSVIEIDVNLRDSQARMT